MRSVIAGSGIGVPANVVTNDALAKIMDTSDEWIRTRSGIQERRYVDPGQGSAELGMEAARNALDAAKLSVKEIDAVVVATMTPNFFFPGNGPVMQARMGFGEIPTFDIRQQCSGFLYALDLADSLIRAEKYKRVLVVGADVHTPFMPWENGWDATIGRPAAPPTPEQYEANTKIRDRTVLFGDGAGAMILEASPDALSPSRPLALPPSGFLASRLYTDGSNIEALYMPGAGFRHRPFVTHEEIDAGARLPVMEGKTVFKEAVSRMPDAVRKVCEAAGVKVSDIDLLLVHQANLRIIEAVAKNLELPAEKVPHNIERYGNTTAGTLPILYHECVTKGLIEPGMLLCFTALGSGLHWGAALYRT